MSITEPIDYAAKARATLSQEDGQNPGIVSTVIFAQAVERFSGELQATREAMDSLERMMREADYNQHMRFVNSK